MMKLDAISDLSKLEHLLDHAVPKVRSFGGRCVVYQGCEYTLNSLVKILQNLSPPKKQTQSLAARIRHLDAQAQLVFKKAGFVRRLLTYIRQYFGNLRFDRNQLLNKLEFDGKIPATSNGTYRLLVLTGEKGKVACRIRGECASAIPILSKHSGTEWSIRSHFRMRNLISVRGGGPGTRMIGPADYFGNLEDPHKHFFTINISDKGVPVVLREELNPDAVKLREAEKKAKMDPSPFTTRVEALWHKGSDRSTKEVLQKYQEGDRPVVGPSIFLDSGILEMPGDPRIVLKKVDARTLDLSSFRARLEDNQIPFQIISEKLRVSDEYRAISYFYEPQYARHQVEHGGGLFLESHQFAQTITPLDAGSKGFVTLARWNDDRHTALDIIGIEIPFGYTLIVEKFCIHGDTNLNGMYMMCMTSDHISMRSADTVFLKHVVTKRNIDISLEEDEKQAKDNHAVAPRPFATYGPSEDQQFSAHLKENDVIVNYSLKHRAS